ncbi:MAG: hypothetical protein C0483_10055 [Pirellula sp.]|nr:hypothetical protein [Pirellula sp.]
MVWSLFVLPLAGFLYWRWKVAGPSIAIGESILWSLLVPSWITLPIAGLPFDVTSTVACLGLILYCFHPAALFRTTLCLTDGAVFAMFCVHILSDSLNEGFHIGIPCRAYGEWIVPYLAGRISVRDAADVRTLRSTACVVAIILGIWSATEAIWGHNPVNMVAGVRPIDDMPLNQLRWNFKRAEGPTTHPIWLGMVQALLLPWTLSAAISAMTFKSKRWRLSAPICNLAGVFFSLSRGPWCLVLLTLYGTAVCRLTRFRKLLIFLGATACLGAAISPASVVEVLQSLTSHDRPDTNTVTVDKQRVKLDETTYRIVLFDVYREAMLRAGLLGFGTDRTTGFPVRVPMGVLDVDAMKKVQSIDNAYILMQLRFGLLGVISLLVILSSAALISLRRGAQERSRLGVFHALTGSTLLSLIVVLAAEYIPRDYGFLLFWTIGITAGFDAYHSKPVPATTGRF